MSRSRFWSLTRLSSLVVLSTSGWVLCCSGLRAQDCVFHSRDGRPYSRKKEYLPQDGSKNGTKLKILALGDSVVWGDGDTPEHKIVDLVSRQIANATGRPVELHVYAHSGARLYAHDSDAKPGFPVFAGKPLGDLDGQRPTSYEQSVCASKVDQDAEYILLDGCINEVGAEQIALPPPLYPVLNPGNKSVTPAEIRANALSYCSNNMANTLIEITQKFSKAHVVVLDYFRVVSTASKPEPATDEAARKHQQTEDQQREKRVEQAVKKAQHIRNGATNEDAVKAAAQGWGDNADEFLKDSTSCFKWAIDAVNAGVVNPFSQPPPPQQYSSSDPESQWPPVCPTFSKAAAAIGSPPAIPVVVAPFPDNPQYSYGASDTHLWLLPLLFYPHDELYWPRAFECTLHLFRGDTSCYINPIAHPNPNGARCYSESILGALGFDLKDPDPDCQSR